MKLKINRPLKNGRMCLSPKDQADIKKFYEHHKDGDVIILQMEKFKKNRSDPQLRYYFGVVVKTLSNELGYHVDEMHELLKHMFNPKMVQVKDYCVELGGSTGKLKTDEMEDYLSKIRMWASADLNIFIPLPNEAYHG